MHVRIPAAAVVAALLAAGCGGPTGARMSGEVTYDGQPVAGGYVTVTPADGRGPDVAGPIKDGKYTVTGLTPGPKVVKVIATKKVNFASASDEMRQKEAAARRAKNYDGLIDPADAIPPTAGGNNVTVDLQPGDNKLDLHLTAPPPAARR